MSVLAEERNMGILHFIVLGWPKSSLQFCIRYYRKIQTNIIVFIEPTQFNTSLYYASQILLFFFLINKLKACSNPAYRRFFWWHFWNSICLLYVSVSHVGNPHNESESESCSVLSNSLRLQKLYSPQNSPGQNIGVCSLSLLHGTFPTQGSNSGLSHCWQSLYQLNHRGSPRILEWIACLFSRGSSWSRYQTGSPALQEESLSTELSGKPKPSQYFKLFHYYYICYAAVRSVNFDVT